MTEAEKLQKLRIEIQEKEAKIRALKAEKLELDSDIRNSTKKKEVLESSVKSVQGILLTESTKKRVLSKEVKDLEDMVKESQKKIDKSEVIFKNQKQQLAIIEEKNNAMKSSNDKSNRDLISKNDTLKNDMVILEREKIKLEKDKVRFKETIENIKKQIDIDTNAKQQKLKDELDLAKKDRAELKAKIKNAEAQIKDTEDLKKDLKSKISKQKEITQEYIDIIHEYKKASKELAKERLDVVDTQKSYMEAKDKANKSEISFIAQQGAMDTKEKELEIAELRLKKLIRDKKIDTELEQLKGELK